MIKRAVRARRRSPTRSPRPARLRLQEQGRAAAARRGRRLPAVAARRPADDRRRPEVGRRGSAARASTEEPFSALAFKVMSRSVRRQAHVLPRLLRQDQGRRPRAELDAPARRSASAASCRCTRTIGRSAARSWRGTSPRASGSRPRRRATRSRAENAPIVLESMTFPDPVIAVAVEPKTKADQDKLGAGLARLAEEDPTFRVSTDEETGQTIIEGMGELHLEIIVDRLKREFNVDANVGRPAGRVPRDRRQGGREHPREVRPPDRRLGPVRGRRDQPRRRRRRATATSSPTGSPAARSRRSTSLRSTTASRRRSNSGVLAGYPIVDVKVELTDGSYHEVDSNEMAFKIAGSMAFKEAMKRSQAEVARARDGRRGDDAGGLPRRRDG